MLESTAALLDKILSFTGKTGMVLLAVGGVLWLTVALEIIPEANLGGYVAQSAPVLTFIGLALLLVAAGLKLVEQVPGFMARRRERTHALAERHAETERLMGNLHFLDQKGILLLLVMLREPSGRWPRYQHHDAFDDLLRLSLIGSETYSLSWPPMGILRVHPLIYSRRAEVEAQLTPRVTIKDFDQEALDAAKEFFQRQ